MTLMEWIIAIIGALLAGNLVQWYRNKFLKNQKEIVSKELDERIEQEEKQHEHDKFLENQGKEYKESIEKFADDQKNESPDTDWNMYDSPKLREEPKQKPTVIQSHRPGNKKPTN